MAENLIDYSHKNVVHTSAHYLFGHETHFKLSEHATLGDIANLQAKEQALYNKFQASNYQQFIKIIQQLVASEKDRQILASFEPETLDKEFEGVRSGYLTTAIDKEVQIVFKDDQANKKLQKALKMLLDKGYQVKKSGDLLSFKIGFIDGQAGIIKHLLNLLYSEQLHYSNEKLTRALREAIADKIRKGELNIISDGSQPTLTEVSAEYLIDNYPWGYTKREIEIAISRPGSEEEKAFLKAMDIVKDFIIQKCKGCSQDFMDAVNLVYDKKIGNNPLNFRFFTGAGGGKNSMLKAIKGSLGEFQAALMFEYFNKRLGFNNSIATIVGNLPARGSEQGKADLSIYEMLGVQVKNWNEFMQHNIETNIHPIAFAETMSDGDAFLQFIANIYFNTSYAAGRKQDLDSLEVELEQRVRELQNLDMVKGLKDKVSFYLIQGRYLVPASELLSLMLDENGILPPESIWIDSKYKGKSDTEYKKLTKEGKNVWWKKEQGRWEPDDQNKKEFDNLVSKSISIRTKMDLSGKLERYNILTI